jgi:hypothetical protein
VLVDLVALSPVRLVRVGRGQILKDLLDRHPDSRSGLLTFTPLQHQLLLLEGCQEFPRYLLDLVFLFVGQGHLGLGQQVEDGEFFLAIVGTTIIIGSEGEIGGVDTYVAGSAVLAVRLVFLVVRSWLLTASSW